MEEKVLQEILTNIPCREMQVKYLASLLIQNSDNLPNCIFLYGPNSSGKTTVITDILQHTNMSICHQDCVEFCTSRFMYESILNQLSGNAMNKENNYCSYANCDSMNSFIRHLSKIYSEQRRGMAIVLEHSERLRDCDINVLPVLFRLQEYAVGVNVTVIMMTQIPYENFLTSMSFKEPIIVPFPQYNRDEVTSILLKSCPSGYSEEFYHTYLSIVLNVFYSITRNLSELSYLVDLNFKKYCEPIEKDEADEKDIHKLWRYIEPHLKKTLATVYLREVSSSQFEKMQALAESCDSSVSKFKSNSAVKVELPYYSKFLLIAAYLASYNPVKSDKRFFVKNHGKQRKTKAYIRAKDQFSTHLVGPKVFPLDRLLAIFYAIVEDKISPTTNIFIQISSLVTLKFIAQIGDDPLNCPKYKCAVSLDFVRNIARTVNFDITRYLYEFA